MDTSLISNLIDVSLCLVALFISVRSFDVYVHFHYIRLFILGLSMTFVSLAAAADFTASYVKFTPLSTDWFFYVAQALGFLFIFLSLVWGTDKGLRSLMFLSILTVPFLVVLLFLSPFLPGVPDGLVRVLLESTRWLICLMIFFAYFLAFISEATHFNRFMATAFLLISFGNFMSLEQSIGTKLHSHLLSNVGNLIDIVGLVALVIAVSWN